MPFQPRPRILCVDDDADACEMLSALMRAHGIDATCAGSAAEAWALLNAAPFDLYLLDGWLPGLDGFDFCRQLRKAHPDAPILFYSGAAYETDKRRGMAAGASGYVVKPDIEGLIRMVNQLFANVGSKSGVGRRVGFDVDRAKGVGAFEAFRYQTASD